MAEPARYIDPLAAPVSAPAASAWSGEVHGPVAALHRAIEAGLAEGPTAERAMLAERPVDHALRLASRATGWLVLAAGFAATAHAII